MYEPAESENWVMLGNKHMEIIKDQLVYEDIKQELEAEKKTKQKKKHVVRFADDDENHLQPKSPWSNSHTPHPSPVDELSKPASLSSKPPSLGRRLFTDATSPIVQKQIETPTKIPAKTAEQPKDLWWTAALFIFLSHLVIIYMCIVRYPVTQTVFVYTIWQAWLQLLGITAGYHRLWSHRSFEAKIGVRIFLAIIGLQSFQGSIYWWAMRHRIHHRFTDSPNDPYDSTRGFWYSHIMWLFQRPPRFEKLTLVGSYDLKSDVVVVYQQKYLLLGYVIFGAIYPAIMGKLLSNDAMMGVLWIGVVARFLSWHCIWSINSVSHWIGEKDFSLRSTAVHNFWLSIFQNGEGHHNYHHEFPADYRHGLSALDWDPTKWCIALWYYLGWASNLRTTPFKKIANSQIKVLEKKALILREESHIKPNKVLKLMTREDFQYQTKKLQLPWILIDGMVVDVSTFDDHPGGQNLLRAHYGKDATKAFHGGIAIHTESAENLLEMYAIATIVDTASTPIVVDSASYSADLRSKFDVEEKVSVAT